MNPNIVAFFDKVQNSSELQQKLETIEERLKQQRADSLAELSQEAGTPVASEEFLATAAAASQELDEVALEGVTGGATNPIDIRPAARIIKGWLGLD